MAEYTFELSDTDKLSYIIDEHIKSLAQPLDSWLEDSLLRCRKYGLKVNAETVGYCGLSDGTLSFFFVLPKHFRHAPALLEAFISANAIKRVFVMTQDLFLCALICEWDYDVEREACFFIDSTEEIEADAKGTFRLAQKGDCQSIRDVCGAFFEDASCGYNCLEERVDAGTIFMLEEREELLGCGIIERGIFCKGCVSIGMYTNPAHRKKGVAKTILLRLKEWAYQNGFKPVAGCWYYNTVSRMSLESAGMIAASKGYEAKLKGKEKLPLRTGNPPGELIE